MKTNKITSFESFINFMISSLFTIMFLFVVAVFSDSENFNLMGTPLYFCSAVIIISQLVFQTLLDMFTETKKRVGLHSRILFFSLVIIILVCYLFDQIYAPYFLIPGTIIEYLFTVLLNKPVFYQKKFLNQIEYIEPQKLGPELRADSLTVETLNKSIDKSKLYLEITSIFILIELFALYHFEKNIEFPNLLFFVNIIAVLYCISTALLVTVYNIYQKNTYFAFLGFKNVINKKSAIIKYSLIIIIISSISGFFLSSSKALIKINLPSKQKNYHYKQAEPQPVPTIEFNNPDKIELKDTLGQNEGTNPILELIMDIFYWLFIAALAVFLVYLFFRYIITDSFSNFFKENLLWQIIKDILEKLNDFFANFFKGGNDSNENYATVSAKSFKFHIDSIIKKSKKSAEKKQELDKLTKKFMQIISWGENQDIKYKNTMGPGEYISLIQESILKLDVQKSDERADKQSDKKSDENSDEKSDVQKADDERKFSAKKIGYLYEKSLYSEELLTSEEIKTYFTLCDELLKISL